VHAKMVEVNRKRIMTMMSWVTRSHSTRSCRAFSENRLRASYQYHTCVIVPLYREWILLWTVAWSLFHFRFDTFASANLAVDRKCPQVRRTPLVRRYKLLSDVGRKEIYVFRTKIGVSIDRVIKYQEKERVSSLDSVEVQVDGFSCRMFVQDFQQHFIVSSFSSPNRTPLDASESAAA
jgi:hypothetical protein